MSRLRMGGNPCRDILVYLFQEPPTTSIAALLAANLEAIFERKCAGDSAWRVALDGGKLR